MRAVKIAVVTLLYSVAPRSLPHSLGSPAAYADDSGRNAEPQRVHLQPGSFLSLGRTLLFSLPSSPVHSDLTTFRSFNHESLTGVCELSRDSFIESQLFNL